MYPHERSLVKQLADKPFALIGINSDRDLEGLREVVKEKNITWRSFWNGPQGTGGPISTEWGVMGGGTTVGVDLQGLRHAARVKAGRGTASCLRVGSRCGDCNRWV